MSESNLIKKSALSPTVLIVGGAGFIGSHLSEALLKKDARVIVLDNFSTGKDIYVHNLLDNPKFALFNVDINKGLPKEIQSVDYVFQLAGLETYLFDKDDLTLDSLLTNALGIKNILDFVKKSEAKMLLGSTIDIYKGLISPITLENYFGQTPEEEKKYSLTEAKRYAEALVWEYYKQHNIDVRIARLPEVYGPRMNLDSSGSLGFLIRCLVENNDLVVYGDGVEKEFYVYISDAIAGLVKALFSEGTKGKIYTFTDSESHSVLEITYLVKSLANSEARVVFQPKPNVIQAQEPRIPDRSSLKELNWEEKVSFKDGVINTLRWLHYEPNENSFKPGALIGNQSEKLATAISASTTASHTERKTSSKNSIFSIVDLVTHSDSSHKEENHMDSLKPISISDNSAHTPLKAAPSPNLVKPLKGNVFSKMRGLFSKQPLGSVSSAENKDSMFKNPWFHRVAYVFMVLFASITVFGGLPLLQAFIQTKKGVSALESVQQNLLALQTDSAQQQADVAFKEFYKAQNSLSKASWLFTVVGQKGYLNDSQNLLNSAENTSKALYFIAKGSQPLTSLAESLKPDSAEVLETGFFDASRISFNNALSNLRLAEAALQQVDESRFPDSVTTYKDNLGTLSVGLDSLVAVSSDLDYLLGLDSPKKYLILFQNSNELRATGGFIGSYAVLDVDKGKMTNLLIDDVYNPDGQIDLREIALTPPEPISTYLDEEVLHIRNANWDPDFPESAKDIEELFFRIDGRRFDGVLAVDLHFVEELLKATGPIYIAAYNEEINSGNLYERAQFHSEFNYENGSDQKRSFLTVLGGKMLEKIFSADNEDFVKITKSLATSLNQKHLLVSVPDSSLNAYLEQQGWNGSLLQTENSDYLYVVNSNVGGTKANYYVENTMNYSVLSKTRDGLLRGVLDLTYKHNGLDTSWPGGPYTNYVRVLTQRGSKLTGAKLTLEDGTIVDVFDSVIVAKSGRYNSFEFAFILDPQKTAKVTFEYDLSPELSITKDSKDYKLVWQKQPGTQDDAINFQFNAPFGTFIENTIPEMLIGSSTANYTGLLNTDQVFDLTLK